MEYQHRPRPSTASELKTELIRNAAFVAHEGQKAKELATWLRGGNKPRRAIFVFDTDVIISFCAPWLNGPVDDRVLGQGYGQILPQKPLVSYSADERQNALIEERRRAEAVCWLLAHNAIDRALEGGVPVAQTRAHFEETLRVYEGVKRNADAEPVATRMSLEERRDHSLSQSLRFVRIALDRDEWPIDGNPGRFLSSILNRMQDQDLQRLSRFVREWDAFLHLFRRGNGIFSLAEFAPPADLLSEAQALSWAGIREMLAEAERLGKRRESVEALRLQQVITPMHDRKPANRSIDAASLAEVEAVSRRLSETGGDDSFRVVLVTGDRKAVLALASSNALLSKGGMSVSDFAFKHVHHLWSLVDNIAVGGSRSELFSGFLAFDDEEDDRTAYIGRLVRYAVRGDQSLASRFLSNDVEQAYERWNDFSEGAANLHRHFLLDPGKNEEISRILIQKLKRQRIELAPETLNRMAVETMTRARDRAKVEFSEIGANSILDAHRNGVRNPPDLMFDSLKTTDLIFKDLALPKRVFISAEDFARRFERIADDCYQPDPDNLADDDFRQECYLKYLVLGSLFASADRWIVTEQHAQSAVRIIERSKELSDPIKTLAARPEGTASHMSGREAHFLLAVAKRVRAKGVKAYELAEHHLEKARSCLNEDRMMGSGLRVPFIRFDCEELALRLARYYHERWSSKGQRCDEKADNVYSSARSLMEKRDAMGRHKEGADNPYGDRIENLPPSTAIGIAINLIQVAVISCFREMRGFDGTVASPVTLDHVEQALDTVLQFTNLKSEIHRNNTGNPGGPADQGAKVICSPLMMLYAVVGAMLTGDRRIRTPASSAEIDRLFASQRPSITAYDVWRFPMLNAFAKELLLRRK